MSQIQLDRFYKVNRSRKTSSGQKRACDSDLVTVTDTDTPKSKRPAHIRFANLANTQEICVPSTTFHSPGLPVKGVIRNNHLPLTTQVSENGDHMSPKAPIRLMQLRDDGRIAKKTRSPTVRTPKSVTKKTTTKSESSSVSEPGDHASSKAPVRLMELRDDGHVSKKTRSPTVRTPRSVAKKAVTKSESSSLSSSVHPTEKTPVQKAARSTKTDIPAPRSDTRRAATKVQPNSCEPSSKVADTISSVVVEKPPVPLPSTTSSTSIQGILPRVPAHERFADLVGGVGVNRKSVAPLSPARLLSSIVPPTPVVSGVELTQTEEELPPGLALPHHFRVLLELFRSCDTVVSMLHNRLEICGFDKLKPAVQEVVRRNFEETHVGQFLAVYPMVYLLRYEKQLDKFLRRPTGNYVLVLAPNLRTDGTQLGHDSPSKGHITFTGTRLIQRRKRFHRLLLGHVFRAHREFLQSKLGIDASELPDDKELRRWHPRFCLDTMIPSIQPAPLPVRPSAMDNKITTAKDAVKAFQARALFRDAEACQNVANLRQQGSVPSIPSPTKLSACSPRKPPLSLQQGSDGLTKNPLPSMALFKSSSSVDEPTSPAPVAKSLKGVSEALLAKVRARENERRLLTMLALNTIPESRRAIYARLPSMITQVWTVMRTSNGRPVPMSTVASRVADAHPSGLSADVVNEHLKVLLEVCPTWLQKLNWSTPHLCISDPGRSVKDVIDWVKIKLADEGFQF